MSYVARILATRRHPIKAHGREGLISVPLTAGETMPWDHRRAATHKAAQTAGGELDTPGALDRLRGRRDFGICADVKRGGTISVDGTIEIG